jgi:hypothetical protein
VTRNRERSEPHSHGCDQKVVRQPFRYAERLEYDAPASHDVPRRPVNGRRHGCVGVVRPITALWEKQVHGI